jgi:hypothetical protein
VTTAPPITNAPMGTFVPSIPVPHDPAVTTYVQAGPVTFGVEPRVFDPVAEAAKLTAEEVAAAGPDALFHAAEPDSGVCLHVFDSVELTEWLRFDCFDGEPHYHYIVPGQGNMLVRYDRTANGPMLPWAVGVLRRRLPEMLALLGAGHLAVSLDPDRLAAALDHVERLTEPEPEAETAAP